MKALCLGFIIKEGVVVGLDHERKALCLGLIVKERRFTWAVSYKKALGLGFIITESVVVGLDYEKECDDYQMEGMGEIGEGRLS